MGINKKNYFFGIEIIYNNLGQIRLKKRFLSASTLHFYRYILRSF